MSYLTYYSIFAITTALVSCFELLRPTFIYRRSKNKPIENETITYIVFFMLGLLAAPVVFFSCIVPSWGARFRVSLYKGLFD